MQVNGPVDRKAVETKKSEGRKAEEKMDGKEDARVKLLRGVGLARW